MPKQFENHMVEIVYVGFLCVWLITKMLMFKQAFKPWDVFFVTIVLFCNSKTQNEERSHLIKYNKWNNNIVKTCEWRPFYYCKNV